MAINTATKGESFKDVEPSVLIEKLEVPDDFLAGIAFNVGQILQTAIRDTKDNYPGWATVWQAWYDLMDDVFMGAE